MNTEYAILHDEKHAIRIAQNVFSNTSIKIVKVIREDTILHYDVDKGVSINNEK